MGVVGIALAMSGGPAHAAGGNGASGCSVAGNPATNPNPGAMIREHQPFGGNGNDGSNPGFNFNGFSGCKPG
ncbi:MAG: hypothetical protein ACXV9P_06230 [Acidimicrobiia bacterium]